MKNFNKHIAILLFAGFAFPQVANSMHYFVVPHYSYSNEAASQQFTPPAYDYHSCDYTLTGLNFILTSKDRPDHQVKSVNRIQPPDYRSGHKIELAFNYRLRGPPKESTSV